MLSKCEHRGYSEKSPQVFRMVIVGHCCEGSLKLHRASGLSMFNIGSVFFHFGSPGLVDFRTHESFTQQCGAVSPFSLQLQK